MDRVCDDCARMKDPKRVKLSTAMANNQGFGVLIMITPV